MNEKSETTDQGCQLFEFAIRTTNGTQLFVYTMLEDDAERLSGLFSQLHPLEFEGQFIEFTSVSGRVVHLNLDFLIAVSRLDLMGRVADQSSDASAAEDGAAHNWPSLGDFSDPPDLALLVDGLVEPVVCHELAQDELESVARALQEDPTTATSASGMRRMCEPASSRPGTSS